MKIYIKNMVCQGTKKFVLREIKNLGLNLKSFESDVMEFQSELSPHESEVLILSLRKYGLEAAQRKNGRPRSANSVNMEVADDISYK
jgi:hypothetical protein